MINDSVLQTKSQLTKDEALRKFEVSFKKEVGNDKYRIIETNIWADSDGWNVSRRFVKGATLYSLGEFFPFESDYFAKKRTAKRNR